MITNEAIKTYCKRKKYSKEYAEFWCNNRFCECCRMPSSAPHHIHSRGAHGNIDDDWNLLNLCLEHHNMLHAVGEDYFIKKYPGLKDKFKKAKEKINE